MHKSRWHSANPTRRLKCDNWIYFVVYCEINAIERNRVRIDQILVIRRTDGKNTSIMNQLVCQHQRRACIIYSLVSFTNSIRTLDVLCRSSSRFSNSSTLTRRFGVSSEISPLPSHPGKIENSLRWSKSWCRDYHDGRDGTPAWPVLDRKQILAGRR